MDILVKKDLPELVDQLNKRTDFLKNNQYPLLDFSTSQMVFRGTYKPSLKSFGRQGKNPGGDPNTKGKRKGEEKGKREVKESSRDRTHRGRKGDNPPNPKTTEAENSGAEDQRVPKGNKGKNKKMNNKGKSFQNPQNPPSNEGSEGDGCWQVSQKRGRSQNRDQTPTNKSSKNQFQGARYGNHQEWAHQGPSTQAWAPSQGQMFGNPQGLPQMWTNQGQGPFPAHRGRGRFQGRGRGGRGSYHDGNQTQGIILSKREMGLIQELRKPQN